MTRSPRTGGWRRTRTRSPRSCPTTNPPARAVHLGRRHRARDEYEDVAPTYHRAARLGRAAAIIVSVVQYTSAYERPIAGAPRGGGAPGGGAAGRRAPRRHARRRRGRGRGRRLARGRRRPVRSAPNATDGAAGCGTAPQREPRRRPRRGFGHLDNPEASATTESVPKARSSAPQQRTSTTRRSRPARSSPRTALRCGRGDAAATTSAFDLLKLAGGRVCRHRRVVAARRAARPGPTRSRQPTGGLIVAAAARGQAANPREFKPKAFKLWDVCGQDRGGQSSTRSMWRRSWDPPPRPQW